MIQEIPKLKVYESREQAWDAAVSAFQAAEMYHACDMSSNDYRYRVSHIAGVAVITEYFYWTRPPQEIIDKCERNKK
jgi:hypothetical protein